MSVTKPKPFASPTSPLVARDVPPAPPVLSGVKVGFMFDKAWLPHISGAMLAALGDSERSWWAVDLAEQTEAALGQLTEYLEYKLMGSALLVVGSNNFITAVATTETKITFDTVIHDALGITQDTHKIYLPLGRYNVYSVVNSQRGAGAGYKRLNLYHYEFAEPPSYGTLLTEYEKRLDNNKEQFNVGVTVNEVDISGAVVDITTSTQWLELSFRNFDSNDVLVTRANASLRTRPTRIFIEAIT